MPDGDAAAKPGNDGSAEAQNGWVRRVLGVEIAAAKAQKPAPSLVVLQKSRLVWDQTRKSILQQLNGLTAAINTAVRAHNEDEEAEDEFDEGELAQGVTRLYGILEKLDTRLIDKLDEALNASGEERAALNREAAVIVAQYQAFVSGDATIARIDANGFTATTIRPTVEATLKALAAQL